MRYGRGVRPPYNPRLAGRERRMVDRADRFREFNRGRARATGDNPRARGTNPRRTGDAKPPAERREPERELEGLDRDTRSSDTQHGPHERLTNQEAYWRYRKRGYGPGRGQVGKDYDHKRPWWEQH